MDSTKKLKRKANEKVDVFQERILDPKYKTELCKKFEESKFCPYGNKCRFAHGREELFVREDPNYKRKNCKSFHSDLYCSYGSRCLFKHGLTLTEIQRSYYTSLLSCEKGAFLQKNEFKLLNRSSRLQVFRQACCSNGSMQSSKKLGNKDNYQLSDEIPNVSQGFLSSVNFKEGILMKDFQLSTSTNNCSLISSSPQNQIEEFSEDS